MKDTASPPGISLDKHAKVMAEAVKHHEAACRFSSALAEADAENIWLREALNAAYNYWPEPSCMSADCDNGYHVEASNAYKMVESTIAGLRDRRGTT